MLITYLYFEHFIKVFNKLFYKNQEVRHIMSLLSVLSKKDYTISKNNDKLRDAVISNSEKFVNKFADVKKMVGKCLF